MALSLPIASLALTLFLVVVAPEGAPSWVLAALVTLSVVPAVVAGSRQEQHVDSRLTAVAGVALMAVVSLAVASGGADASYGFALIAAGISALLGVIAWVWTMYSDLRAGLWSWMAVHAVGAAVVVVLVVAGELVGEFGAERLTAALTTAFVATCAWGAAYAAINLTSASSGRRKLESQ